MKTSLNPTVWSGLSVASMVTIALLGILFFGWKVAGLPFVPFDAFDALTRILPGPIIASGIGTMVAVIRTLNLGPTADTAKFAEQAMAIAVAFVAGVAGGAILFVILRAAPRRYAVGLGLVLGTLPGVLAALIVSRASQTATVELWARTVWVIAAFLGWGAVLAWAEWRLIDIERATDATVTRIDRRRFLVKLGGTTAAITVAGAAVGELAEAQRRQAIVNATAESLLWSTTHSLPNASATVGPAPGTRPEFTPLERHYRIDINTIPPKVDGQHWRLEIKGLVEKPLSFTLEDLQRYEPTNQFVTLSCISNPVGGDLTGTQRWTGVSLQRLLPDLRLTPSVTHLKMRSADDFFEIISLDSIKADPRVLLVYAWDGVPLKQEHGYPLRIYIPDVYGMKQPKWIESIEAMDHWEPGFWVERGWNKVAQMLSTSVIDTIAVDMTIIGADRNKLVPIGGIAHAGDRGISKVEVQVDEGPWEQAELRTPLSGLTWVIWKYDWPFQSGRHNFTVRCHDGNGTVQTPAIRPPEPNGASGLYSKSMMI